VGLTLSENASVLVQQQHHVGNLVSNRGHVVGVESVLDSLVDRQIVVNHNTSNHHEDNVEGHDGLFKDLEDDDAGRGGGVHTGTDQDQTDKDTDQGIRNGGKTIRQKSKLEQTHGFSNSVHGSVRFLPFNEDPSDSNGRVDQGDDANSLEDTGSQGGSSKTTSTLLHESYTLLVDSFFIRHLKELLVSHG